MMYIAIFQRATCGVFFELFNFEPISPEVAATVCGTERELRIVMTSLRAIFGDGYTDYPASHVREVALEVLFLVSCSQS